MLTRQAIPFSELPPIDKISGPDLTVRLALVTMMAAGIVAVTILALLGALRVGMWLGSVL